MAEAQPVNVSTPDATDTAPANRANWAESFPANDSLVPLLIEPAVP